MAAGLRRSCPPCDRVTDLCVTRRILGSCVASRGHGNRRSLQTRTSTGAPAAARRPDAGDERPFERCWDRVAVAGQGAQAVAMTITQPASLFTLADYRNLLIGRCRILTPTGFARA